MLNFSEAQVIERSGTDNEGCLYKERTMKGVRKGNRRFSDRWCAQIMIDGVRHRHRSYDPQNCIEWLNSVRMGKIKPTDKGADWLRMEQKKDLEIRFDEVIVSATEEAFLMYGFHQSGNLSDINKYMIERLLPHMVWYCCHTLHIGQSTSIDYAKQAAALLLTRITSGKPVMNFTATAKRMLRIRKDHRDFWYYEKAPEKVKMIINNIDFSPLSEVWKVTKDRRI